MATIDLGLVKGDTGPQGPQGIPGDAGPQGPTGATGPAGADGVTPNVQAGATTTLPAGSDATVTRRAGSKGIRGTPDPRGRRETLLFRLLRLQAPARLMPLKSPRLPVLKQERC